jgi:hypothetical protein
VTGGSGGGTAKQKRFWKDVHVRRVDGKVSFTGTHIYPPLVYDAH